MELSQHQVASLDLPDRLLYADYLTGKFENSYPEQANQSDRKTLRQHILVAYDKVRALNITRIDLIYRWMVWEVLFAPGVIDEPKFTRLIKAAPQRANERAEDILAILDAGLKKTAK